MRTALVDKSSNRSYIDGQVHAYFLIKQDGTETWIADGLVAMKVWENSDSDNIELWCGRKTGDMQRIR